MSERDAGDPFAKPTDALERPRAEGGGVRLVVVDGPDKGLSLELGTGAAVVGKSRGCDLTLTDSAVSKRHLRIEVVEHGLRVTDLGSTNGTLYLQTALVDAVLRHGAVLTLGRTRLALASRHPPESETYPHWDRYGELLGAAPAMRRMYATLKRFEAVEHKVLIGGETGVGKELVAHEIHRHSRRQGKGYVVFDCAAVPEELIEAELFGHVRGAYTGAQAARAGVFERADGGTLFLDEIGELPLAVQPALLRVLEQQEVRRVGGNDAIRVDVRVVAATNRDLGAEVEAGRFREDLYHRLQVLDVAVPPLRERREDIPLLVRHFLEASGQGDFELSPTTLELLTSDYDWPGNVRELRNVVARVLVFGSVPEALSEASQPSVAPDVATAPSIDPDESYPEAKSRILQAFEKEYLALKLERAGGNLARAARDSGLDRSYFKRLLARHGLRTKSES